MPKPDIYHWLASLGHQRPRLGFGGAQPTRHARRIKSILAVLFQGRYAEKAYETAKARRNGRDWVMRYNVSRSEFVGYLGAGLNALMASRCPGKRWIEHTPHNTLMVTTMAELFPGAFFLHILRDGRKVVHSMVHFEALLGAEATAETKKLWPPTSMGNGLLSRLQSMAQLR